jgi:hypothetical protein
MARLSKGRAPSGGRAAPIQVSVRGPLARDPSFVKKSAAVAKALAKSAPRSAKTRGGRNSEDPLAGPLRR